ncbi:MAG: hypothetical protein ACK4V1_13115 [Burkholderiaceae bacterium]
MAARLRQSVDVKRRHTGIIEREGDRHVTRWPEFGIAGAGGDTVDAARNNLREASSCSLVRLARTRLGRIVR